MHQLLPQYQRCTGEDVRLKGEDNISYILNKIWQAAKILQAHCEKWTRENLWETFNWYPFHNCLEQAITTIKLIWRDILGQVAVKDAIIQISV